MVRKLLRCRRAEHGESSVKRKDPSTRIDILRALVKSQLEDCAHLRDEIVKAGGPPQPVKRKNVPATNAAAIEKVVKEVQQEHSRLWAVLNQVRGVPAFAARSGLDRLAAAGIVSAPAPQSRGKGRPRKAATADAQLHFWAELIMRQSTRKISKEQAIISAEKIIQARRGRPRFTRDIRSIESGYYRQARLLKK